MKLLANSQIGTYRGIQYGIEDTGDQRYYFDASTYGKPKFIYADTEEGIWAKIDAYLDKHNYVKSTRWDGQFIPDDVYDDNSDSWFDYHATSFTDVYDFIMTNIPKYKKHFGFKLKDDSDEFYVMLKGGDVPTVIGSDIMLKMAKENWTYDDIDNFVLDRLAEVKDRFGHRLKN